MIVAKAIYMVVSVALSYAAQMLLKKDQTSPTLNDDKPNTASTRGSMIPVLKGRNRLGAVIGWVGNRKVVKESAGGGKKGGSKSKSYTKVYYEDALHFICVGPVYSIHEILANGAVIWSGEMTRTDNPEKAVIDLGSEGTVHFYWGTDTQAVATELAGDYERNSAWRGVCYAVWIRRKLGTAPNWHIIDYDVEVRPANDYLSGTSTLSWLPFNGDGWHPSAALYELLFSAPPLGAGLDSTQFDIPSLSVAVGDVLRRERVPCRILLQNGASWKSGVATVLQDFGILIGWDITAGKYKFVIQRESSDTLQTIPESLIEDSVVESLTQHYVNYSDRAVYTFTDADRNYKESTVVWSSEGSLVDLMYPKDTKVTIASVTNWDAAVTVSERRSQEDFAKSGVYSMKASREALLMYPGQRFYLENDTQSFILLSSSRVPEEGIASLTAMRDIYNLETEAYSIANSGLPSSEDAAEDDAVSILETNRFLNKDTLGVYILRIRASEAISDATILFSLDAGVTYNIAEGGGLIATGGTLTEEFSGDFSLTESGPEVSLLGVDLDSVSNLTGAEDDWRAGLQLCIVGSEIMFLRNITVLTDTTFSLDGVLRGRYGTKKEAHAIGTPVFILDSQSLQLLSGSYMTAGSQIYFKILPQAWNDSVQPADVSPIIVDITGGGYKAIAPINLNSTNDCKCWSTGGDLDLKWSYRNASETVSGAGFQPAGTAIQYVPPEGTFTLKFYTSADVYKGAVTEIATATYTFDQAALVAMYGSEPASIKVKVVNVLNGLESDYTESEFTKI